MSRDYSTISPSARALLAMRAQSDLPFAREAAELVLGRDAVEAEHARFRALPGSELRLRHFVARYRSLDAALDTLGATTIVELGAGLSLRGLALAQHKPVTYLDTDLPEMIETKRGLVEQLASGSLVGDLRLRALDALDADAFRSAMAELPDGPIVAGAPPPAANQASAPRSSATPATPAQPTRSGSAAIAAAAAPSLPASPDLAAAFVDPVPVSAACNVAATHLADLSVSSSVLGTGDNLAIAASFLRADLGQQCAREKWSAEYLQCVNAAKNAVSIMFDCKSVAPSLENEDTRPSTTTYPPEPKHDCESVAKHMALIYKVGPARDDDDRVKAVIQEMTEAAWSSEPWSEARRACVASAISTKALDACE